METEILNKLVLTLAKSCEQRTCADLGDILSNILSQDTK
jgi:hypothetical protein